MKIFRHLSLKQRMNNFIKQVQPLLLISLAYTSALTDTTQLRFANELYDRKDYSQAIVEYRRYLIDPLNAEKDLTTTYLQILRSYYLSSMYSGGINYIQSEIKTGPLSDDITTMLKYYCGLFYLKSGFPGSARTVFGDNTDHPKSIILNTVSNIYLAEWNKADESLFKLNNQNDPLLISTVNELEDLLNKTKNVKLRKPMISGMLSVVLPGSGYANTGKYQTAITSLLINFSLMGSAHELQKNNLFFTGSAVLLIASGWYIGSVWGSVSETYKYNKNQQNHLADKFIQEHKKYLCVEY